MFYVSVNEIGFTCDQICNGATFVKVDRIYNKRDNSPALLFLGVLSCILFIVRMVSRCL